MRTPENRIFTAKDFLNKRVSRREFNAGVADVAKRAVILGGLYQAGINLDAYQEGVELPIPRRSETPIPKVTSFPIEENGVYQIAASPEAQEKVDKNGILIMGHRGGNNEKTMRALAKWGFNYADMDLSSSKGIFGRNILVGHGQTFSLLGVPLAAYDRATGVGKLGAYPTFDYMCDVAADAGIGIFAQLKRGSFDEKDINGIYEKALDAGVSLITHSTRLGDVAKANRVLARLGGEFAKKGLEARVQAVVMDPGAWDRFFEAGYDGVFTNLPSLEHYQNQLEQAFVTVGDMNTIEQIQEARKNNAVNAIMADAGLLIPNILKSL